MARELIRRWRWGTVIGSLVAAIAVGVSVVAEAAYDLKQPAAVTVPLALAPLILFGLAAWGFALNAKRAP